MSSSNDICTCFSLFCLTQTQSGSMSRRASLQAPGQKLCNFIAAYSFYLFPSQTTVVKIRAAIQHLYLEHHERANKAKRYLCPISLLLDDFYANVCSKCIIIAFIPSGLLRFFPLTGSRVEVREFGSSGVREYSAFVFSFPELSVADGQFCFTGKAFYSLSPFLNYIPSYTKTAIIKKSDCLLIQNI